MALVALDGTPLIPVGAPTRQGSTSVVPFGNTQIDAANEACIMIGQVFTEDGASHTIDTSGSSSLGWRTGSVTFANAGTTVKVGIAPLDTANGQPGRASNASDVISFDVSKSLTGGGGGVTANAWQEHVPDSGTKTIANGELVAFCVQATARAGADVVNVSRASGIVGTMRPSVTEFTGGSYSNAGALPNVVITFSDGILGFFVGGFVASVGSSNQSWNNSSGTKEYGNILQFPFPTRAYGASGALSITTGDFDFVLYSDPLGTPAAEKTVSIDANTTGASASIAYFAELFSSPYDIPANTPIGIIAKPTSATNITMPHLTLNASAHQKAWNCGTNGYAANRNTGAFAAQNSSKDRFAIGLLVGAFDNGAGGSGGGAHIIGGTVVR